MSALEGEILEPDDKTGPDQKADKHGKSTDEASVRAGFWRTFRKAAKHVPFSEDLVAAYFCALDPQTPARAKAVILGALAYFVMPLDAIPDIIAMVGFTDDIAVLSLAIATIRSHMTKAHRLAAQKALADFSNDKKNDATG